MANTFFLILLIAILCFKSRSLVRIDRAFNERLEQSHSRRNSNNPHIPNVSVVISMKDELLNARACIECLQAQEYEGEVEIVVVLPNKDDPTYPLVSMFESESDLKIVFSEASGKMIQMHNGVEKSSFDIVAFIDADCRSRPLWLKTLVHELVQSSSDSVGSGGLPLQNSFLSAGEAYDLTISLAAGLSKGGTWTGNVVMWKNSYYAFGGLGDSPEVISVDREINKRMARSHRKHKVVVDQRVLMDIAASSIRELFWQRTRWNASILELGGKASGIAFTRMLRYLLYPIMLALGLLAILVNSLNSIFYVPFIVISACYLIDVFFVRRWMKTLGIKPSLKGVTAYFAVILLTAVSLANAILFYITGKSRKWQYGRHKG
jgi:cellulose synthase/poly-beta-1,6-N-acetylglucosamine synthase-like glycosyltransferase